VVHQRGKQKTVNVSFLFVSIAAPRIHMHREEETDKKSVFFVSLLRPAGVYIYIHLCICEQEYVCV
jgi:hypothetical protein